MHAHEDRSSHGEAHSDRADDGEHSRHGRPSARELDLWRLKEITAYVCVDDLSKTQEDVSPEAKRKRKQRQKDEADKKHYFSVKMPNDDPVLKETIKMVAATLIEDREFHRILDALASDPSLREIIDRVASSPGDAALIAKAARTGGLLQMARVADANGELAQCLGQLAGDGALLEATSVLVRNFSEVAADRSAEEPLRAASAAMRDPAATLKFCEVRKQNGFRARILDWILGLI